MSVRRGKQTIFYFRPDQNNVYKMLTTKPNIYDCYSHCPNEPAHEIIVLITQATSEGSGKPAGPRSLTRAFAVRTQSMEVE